MGRELIIGRWFGWGVWLGPSSPNGTANGAEANPGVDPGCPDGCLFDVVADPAEHVDLRFEQVLSLFCLLSFWFGERVDELSLVASRLNGF